MATIRLSDVPRSRDFGWTLKPPSSSYFNLHIRENGQLCINLEHSLVRGCTAEMIYWWFKHFPMLRVRLDDVEGYEDQVVPAYYLWHPSDHIGVSLSGRLAADGTAQVGANLHIREVMQFDTYGVRFPLNLSPKIMYVAPDGWCMGMKRPVFGTIASMRVHFKDVMEQGKIIGVHYYYETIFGLSQSNLMARLVNTQLKQSFSLDLISAWHVHNTIEVGTFENFLPALYAQRHDIEHLHYAKAMNPELSSLSTQTGYDKALFDKRVDGLKTCRDPYAYQQGTRPTFI